jgi:squalene synthase HpnC
VKMGVGHYENFPVASILLPPRLRPAVRAIYRFARTADDIADEGDDPPQRRLARLDALERQLDAIETAGAQDWPDLAAAIAAFALPTQPLRDLLSAFRQDVSVKRYDTDAQVRDYCRRSADPVGRLMLYLYGEHSTSAQTRSDAICTGLQLTNFLQDVALDWRKGRIYIAQESLRRFDVTESAIAKSTADARWGALMRDQAAAARGLLLEGAPLARQLRGRIGWELRAVVQGGLRILERIDAVEGDVFRHRPSLQWRDWLAIGARTLRM